MFEKADRDLAWPILAIVATTEDGVTKTAERENSDEDRGEALHMQGLPHTDGRRRDGVQMFGRVPTTCKMNRRRALTTCRKGPAS